MKRSHFALIAASLFLISAGAYFGGMRGADAVKPPTKEERAQGSKKKHEWSDLKPGKKAHTKGGRFCECGVSATDENECYVPRAGQLCCNPKTGECRMLDLGKVNTPW